MELNSITFPGLPQPYKVTPASHLDDKNNPHGVTPQQIGAHPDTWVPTAEQVGARPNTWTPTAADVGAAPAGYGLGETSNIGKWNSDANTLTKQGWYRLESGTANGVGESASVRVEGYAETDLTQTAYTRSGLIKQRTCKSGTWSGWVQCDPSAFAPAGYIEAIYTIEDTDPNTANNTLYSHLTGAYNATADKCIKHICIMDNKGASFLGGGCWFVSISRTSDKYGCIEATRYYTNGIQKVSRSVYNGQFQSWEWENPPMVLGVEYRTTERWQGKPVYTKLIDFGTMPNSTVKIVQHGITNIDYPLSASVVAKSASWAFTIPSAYNVETDVLFSLTELLIKTTAARSDYHAYFTVKYTKK